MGVESSRDVECGQAVCSVGIYASVLKRGSYVGSRVNLERAKKQSIQASDLLFCFDRDRYSDSRSTKSSYLNGTEDQGQGLLQAALCSQSVF